MKMKVSNSKKGYSTGFAWFVGLVLLFSIGVVFVVFNQVMMVHIRPQFDSLLTANTLLNVTEKTQMTYQVNKYQAFWGIIPFLFVITVVAFWITTAIRKGKGEIDQ